MGRKSRKEQIALANSLKQPINGQIEKIYLVGLYARKSYADIQGESDGDSIRTQVSMLERYLESRQDLKLYDKYVDNGETGTKFDRPQFNRLMDDIRSGKVNCVVVKDLSRFGRNYMEAGTLLETIFPYMGVRFISVNDGYDSISETANGDTLSISVENLLNDLYAKDISKKINSAYLENFKLGNYMGAYAPYGYLRDAKNPHKFVVDNDAAPIVVQIFKMKAEGMTYQGIADYLNLTGVESPSNYKYRQGILKDKRFAQEKAWLASVLKKMLCNQVYIGNMIQGKQRCRNSTENKLVVMQEPDWFVVENTHEAIIERGLWDTVQQEVQKTCKVYRERRNKYEDRFQPENILAKKIICTECGKYLRRGHQCPKDYIIYNYYCATIHKDGSRCSCRYHNEKKLFAVILDAIKQQIKLAVDTKKIVSEFEKMSSFNASADEIRKSLSEAENKLKKSVSRKTLLYNDYMDGFISLEDYNSMRTQYECEISELTAAAERLTLELYKQKNYKTKKNKWIVAFEKFKRSKTLTRDMVETLIDKIYVHGQYELEIIFNFRDEYMYLTKELDKLKEEQS